jgi:hypothetical protein
VAEGYQKVVEVAKNRFGSGRQLGLQAASVVWNALQLLLLRLWRRLRTHSSPTSS